MRVATIGVLLLATWCVPARAAVFGDWRFDIVGSYREAFTSNNSGSSIGLLCSSDDGKCLFYLRSNTTCTEGATGIALLNAESGAFSVNLFCSAVMLQQEREFVNVLGSYDTLKHSFEDNYDIGFAVPMKDGNFKVLRFSLRGSNEAIRAAVTMDRGFRDYRDELR